MVCVTRASSKNDGEGEAVDVIPPVRTRARTSRKSTTTQRSRRASASEERTNDSEIAECSELTDPVSQAVNNPESQESTVSSDTLVSTPSRRSRRKRVSEAESCGSTNSADLDGTSKAEKHMVFEEEEDSEHKSDSAAVSETPKAASAKPPAPSTRRRRGSSSSSQAVPPASPARITRAMRKAGISTPKDVVELEIVPEEQHTENQDLEHLKKESKERKSPLKSPSFPGESISSPKAVIESTIEKLIIMENEEREMEVVPFASENFVSKQSESMVSSPVKDIHGSDSTVSTISEQIDFDKAEAYRSPRRKTPSRQTANEDADVLENECIVEKPSSSPPKKSPVKESASGDMVIDEKFCGSIKNSPAKEVSPIKTPESVGMEHLLSPTRKSPRNCTAKNSPARDKSSINATPPQNPDSEESSRSPSRKRRVSNKEASSEEISMPENLNLEAEGVFSPRSNAGADEITPMKTGDPNNFDLESNLLCSPTKKSPEKRDSSQDVVCMGEMDFDENQFYESPKKRSPEEILFPMKDQPEEMTSNSPMTKSPRKREGGSGLASPSQQIEERSIESTLNKSPKNDVAPDVVVIEEENFQDEFNAVAVGLSTESLVKPRDEAEKALDTLQVPSAEEPEPSKKAKEKKTKQISRKGTEPKITNEDERRQDGEKYVDLDSFKKLFKRPKYCNKSFERSISTLFTYASKLETRKNDLPLEILSNDVETIWQFISFRSKQISKEFRKRRELLDLDLKLHEEAKSSEDESEEDNGENENEELFEDEEVEADLLNLKDEDLKDLEREMDEMREEEKNEEEENERPASSKKYPKSAVDDKFFSLAEMNAFLDEQDRVEGPGTDILDTADDSWTGTTDYCYEDFFGKKDGAEEPIKGKKKKQKKRTRTKECDDSTKKSKTVRFAMDEEQPETDGEAEASVQIKGEEAPVLLGEVEEQQQEETTLKKSLKRLKETIKKLEAENLAPRSWEMSGEVTAQQRGENELLETHLQFDHGMKKAPEITEVFTERLEDLIKQRIKDKAFDDVVRKKRIEERSEPYRNQAIEEREMVKTSLAEVYEKEYQKAAGETKASNGVSEEQAAIEKQMRELFRLIDALSNFDYTPPEVRPEVRVVSNMAALRVEEVGMNASTDAQLLAPEEVKKRQKGDLKADDERDRTDKLRQRRKKKNRQRAMVELFGEEKAMEGLKKKKKKKVDEDVASAGDEKLKSTAFFSKLQETVKNEIKEKTTKKKKLSKVKSQQVSDGGSKYML